MFTGKLDNFPLFSDQTMRKLEQIHKQTLAVYDKHAHIYDQDRAHAFLEKAWLDRFIALLPSSGKVLDLGCGSGRPVSEYFISQGFQLTGIDASAAMLELCRTRFADGTWLQMDMRALELDTQFDGIVAWWSFFHLTQDEQRHALPKLANLLTRNGALLLSIGDSSGETTGTVAGETVYHASLAADEYESILRTLGFNHIEIELNDKRCGDSSILMAKIN